MKHSAIPAVVGLSCVGIGLPLWHAAVGLEFFGQLLCAFGVLALVVAGILRVMPRAPRLCMGLLVTLSVLCGVGLVAAAVTEGFILANRGVAEDVQSDYVIVLGAAVRGNLPSRSLRQRLDAALSCLRQNQDSICIVSGGRGDNENISEAECMQQYLLEHGIPEGRIWMENKAANTCENIRFSIELIEEKTNKKPETVTIVSSGYHMLRAKMECRSHGVMPKGFGCPTPNVLYRVNYYLREIPGVWLQMLRE